MQFSFYKLHKTWITRCNLLLSWLLFTQSWFLKVHPCSRENLRLHQLTLNHACQAAKDMQVQHFCALTQTYHAFSHMGSTAPYKYNVHFHLPSAHSTQHTVSASERYTEGNRLSRYIHTSAHTRKLTKPKPDFAEMLLLVQFFICWRILFSWNVLSNSSE